MFVSQKNLDLIIFNGIKIKIIKHLLRDCGKINLNRFQFEIVPLQKVFIVWKFFEFVLAIKNIRRKYFVKVIMAEQMQDEMKQCYENLIVIDVGANLTNKKYIRDLDSVIQRAKDSGDNLF